MKPPAPPHGWIKLFVGATLSSLLVGVLGGANWMLWMTVLIALAAAIPCERWRQDYERWCEKKSD